MVVVLVASGCRWERVVWRPDRAHRELAARSVVGGSQTFRAVRMQQTSRSIFAPLPKSVPASAYCGDFSVIPWDIYFYFFFLLRIFSFFSLSLSPTAAVCHFGHFSVRVRAATRVYQRKRAEDKKKKIMCFPTSDGRRRRRWPREITDRVHVTRRRLQQYSAESTATAVAVDRGRPVASSSSPITAVLLQLRPQPWSKRRRYRRPCCRCCCARSRCDPRPQFTAKTPTLWPAAFFQVGARASDFIIK